MRVPVVTEEAASEADSPGAVTKSQNSGLPHAESRSPAIQAGKAIPEIEAHLKSIAPGLRGFVEKAENELAAIVDTFTSDLGKKAIDVAKKRDGSVVDVSDIKAAYAELTGPGTAEKQAWFLALGGLLGGGCLSALAAILLAPTSVPFEWLWWTAIVALGLASTAIVYTARPKKRP
jgi:histone H3/H4